MARCLTPHAQMAKALESVGILRRLQVRDGQAWKHLDSRRTWHRVSSQLPHHPQGLAGLGEKRKNPQPSPWQRLIRVFMHCLIVSDPTRQRPPLRRDRLSARGTETHGAGRIEAFVPSANNPCIPGNRGAKGRATGDLCSYGVLNNVFRCGDAADTFLPQVRTSAMSTSVGSGACQPRFYSLASASE